MRLLEATSEGRCSCALAKSCQSPFLSDNRMAPCAGRLAKVRPDAALTAEHLILDVAAIVRPVRCTFEEVCASLSRRICARNDAEVSLH